jgi:hypothetical protein
MAHYQIISSAGANMGIFQGASEREACETMWEQAGWEPSREDVRGLRDAAGEAGDMEQAEICERALSGDEAAMDECLVTIRNTKLEELTVRRVAAPTYRIVTRSGRGLPTTVDAEGYDTREAAEAIAEDAHDGEWVVEAV